MSNADETLTASEPKTRDRADHPVRVGDPAPAGARAQPPHPLLHPPANSMAVWGPLVAVTVMG